MTWMWRLCIANMRKRKVRTVLTIVGVIIGVISIVSLIALGLGVKRELLADVERDGSITEITIYNDTYSKRKDNFLTDKSLQEIAKLAQVEEVFPKLMVDMEFVYEHYNGGNVLCGVSRKYLEHIGADRGELPAVQGRKPEILMGKDVLGTLFYHENSGKSYGELHNEDEKKGLVDERLLDMSGEKLYANLDLFNEIAEKIPLKVSGMTQRFSYDMYCDIDVLKRFLKHNATDGKIAGQPLDQNEQPYREWIYSEAVVFVDDVSNVDFILEKLKKMGYEATSNKEYVDQMNKSVRIAQILLGGVGMIALVVAVIGIGNTMITAVYDRINEIGILKVLGCDIDEMMLMFLLEAGLIGGIGGLIGILASYGITGILVNQIAVKLLQMPKGTQLAIIPIWLAAAAFLFAIVLGILAGVFPAKWAAKLHPIDAVRK